MEFAVLQKWEVSYKATRKFSFRPTTNIASSRKIKGVFFFRICHLQSSNARLEVFEKFHSRTVPTFVSNFLFSVKEWAKKPRALKETCKRKKKVSGDGIWGVFSSKMDHFVLSVMERRRRRLQSFFFERDFFNRT